RHTRSDRDWSSDVCSSDLRAGVGTTPPNVLGAPNPQSSVIMSNTLGAFLGGTTVGGHHGFDSVAFSLITPPNSGSGGESCFPSKIGRASCRERVESAGESW